MTAVITLGFNTSLHCLCVFCLSSIPGDHASEESSSRLSLRHYRLLKIFEIASQQANHSQAGQVVLDYNYE